MPRLGRTSVAPSEGTILSTRGTATVRKVQEKGRTSPCSPPALLASDEIRALNDVSRGSASRGAKTIVFPSPAHEKLPGSGSLDPVRREKLASVDGGSMGWLKVTLIACVGPT